MQFFSTPPTSINAPKWLGERQVAALERLESLTIPSASEEIWRYTNIDDLDLTAYKPAANNPTINSASEKCVAKIRDAVGAHDALVVTLDGTFLTAHGTPEGVTITSFAEEETELTTIADRDEPFIVAGDGSGQLGVLVRVASGTEAHQPIVVVHVLQTAGALSFPKLYVELGENAKATVIECFMSSTDGDALSLPLTELQINIGAKLSHFVMQDLNHQVICLSRQASDLSKDAQLSSANLVLGSAFGRTRNDTYLRGEGSDSKLAAVYFGEGEQLHDFRTLQEHVGKHTSSDLFFRGAVAGKAHAVYSGLIRIRKGASGTDAMQSNRTLKLSQDAIADSVPNLEIDENDVRCAHASAVGPIGIDERYYLESRGIPAPDAERLIVLGFLDEVLERIPIEGLRNYVRGVLQRKWDSR